jgi:hypothetical protein
MKHACIACATLNSRSHSEKASSCSKGHKTQTQLEGNPLHLTCDTINDPAVQQLQLRHASYNKVRIRFVMIPLPEEHLFAIR